jgi:hypothetical protein
MAVRKWWREQRGKEGKIWLSTSFRNVNRPTPTFTACRPSN